jgi:hypothetical protein
LYFKWRLNRRFLRWVLLLAKKKNYIADIGDFKSKQDIKFIVPNYRVHVRYILFKMNKQKENGSKIKEKKIIYSTVIRIQSHTRNQKSQLL